MGTLPGDWHHRVRAGTDWPGVSVLWVGAGDVAGLVYNSRARIAQSIVCWARCPAWCSVAGSTLLWACSKGDFSLGVNMGPGSIPWNSFGWECKSRSGLCTHACHGMDLKDPDIHVLDGWMLATKTHPARTIQNVTMVGLKNGYTYKNLTQSGEPQRYTWKIPECRRRNMGHCSGYHDRLLTSQGQSWDWLAWC